MSLVLFGFLFFQVEIVILILLRPPLAPSQNICVMRGVMTLPNVLNRAILGPPPRSRSICPPPAQRCVLSPKSPAPLCSAAPPPALVSSATFLLPHPPPNNTFPPTGALCLPSQTCPGEILWISIPKARCSWGTKGQSTLLAEQSYITRLCLLV